jgi:short chain dehydrogenase
MSTTTPLPLAGKSALVTGAARSIGAEIALTLARRGAKVVVHYRSRDTEANQTVDAIREMGAEAVAIGGELTDLDVVRTLFARTIDHFGGVDVVVANAGATTPLTPVAEITVFTEQQRAGGRAGQTGGRGEARVPLHGLSRTDRLDRLDHLPAIQQLSPDVRTHVQHRGTPGHSTQEAASCSPLKPLTFSPIFPRVCPGCALARACVAIRGAGIRADRTAVPDQHLPENNASGRCVHVRRSSSWRWAKRSRRSRPLTAADLARPQVEVMIIPAVLEAALYNLSASTAPRS